MREKYNIVYEMGKAETIYRALCEEIRHKTLMKRLKQKHQEMEKNIE